MDSISVKEFQNLRDLLHQKCGICLQDDQAYLIETRLSDFAEKLGLLNFTQLYELLLIDSTLLPSVINLMTTNETLWFRDSSCWNALEKQILPQLLKKADNQKSIKIWVAGCSTGQEAYSLAILIDELCRKVKKTQLVHLFDIQAMDISESALEIAREARYNNFDINRGLSVERRNKYFELLQNNFWQLKPNIRLRVHFSTVNLTQTFLHLGKFDLILCRNVTIYFTQEVRSKILSSMVKMLTKEGALLIGATESLWGNRKDFKTVEFEGCVYVKAK